MTVDIKAAKAQAQRADAADLARLLDSSVALWTRAVQRCEGREKSRAQSNLEDSRGARKSIGAVLQADPRCVSAQQSATALQELAVQAAGDRRWNDATPLYRRAMQMWGVAAETCTGAMRSAAVQRRTQSEVDGHNVEHCAPVFDRARTRTQGLHHRTAALAPAERQRELQIAETLWRDATSRCLGPALDVARTNAQSIARDRGTPWVSTPATDAASPALQAEAAASSASAEPRSLAPPPPTTAGPLVSQAGAPAVSVPNSPPLPSVKPKVVEIVMGNDIRLSGRFTADADGKTYSGQGRIVWPNGDRYEGDVVRGRREGQGMFAWANGQTYEGHWENDQPQGRGRMRFANGDEFEGDLVGGKPMGRGTLAFSSGIRYEGQVEAGHAHGLGVMLWPDGQRFEGTWVNGKAEGTGHLRFPDGREYRGEVADDRPHGKGTLRTPSGDLYVGEFGAGQPHGSGRFRWRNGDEYEGLWEAGKRHGRGRFTWANGDRWEGLFKADLQTESGVLVRKGQ